MLYIILVLVVLFVGWILTRVKPRVEERNRIIAMKELRIMEDSGTFDKEFYPSWIDSDYRLNKFANIIAAETKRCEVPELFVEEKMNNENDLKRFLFLAATVEKSGSSFKEQAMFISHVIEGAWSKVYFSEYHKYIDKED